VDMTIVMEIPSSARARALEANGEMASTLKQTGRLDDFTPAC
jgi:hypothetical protein